MKEKSRTNNSFYNMVAALTAYGVSALINFIARAIFIRILGSEYLGLNGLFTNVISMLSIVELGMGSAIIYNLYKPVADNDKEKIKSLMAFYRKSYHIIGIIVCIIGIAIIPLLPYIVGEVTVSINTNIIYLLFLADSVFSYFLSYKRSILYVNQQNYVVQLIHIGYLVIMNVLQLIFLYITKNYYIYLIVKVIMRVVENLCITVAANKMYPYLKEKDIDKLDKKTEKDIFKKIKALFFHQCGSFVINGTDNIIISRFLGLVTVGLYSNYYMIINCVQSAQKQIVEAVTPSVGNLLVTETEEKQYKVFDRIRFINFWISVFCGVSIYVLMEPFVTLWIGEEYLLSTVVLFVLVINYYQKTSRYSYAIFKTAAGIFYEDRFVPIIESVLNIIVSVIGVMLIGLPGVFIGTIISGLALWLFSYPKYVYKKIFKRSYWNYAKETLGYIALFVIILCFTILISNLIVIDNTFLKLVVNALICVITPNAILFIIFRKSDNFKYFIETVKKIFNKILRKKKTA